MSHKAHGSFSWHHSIKLIKLNNFCYICYLKNLKDQKRYYKNSVWKIWNLKKTKFYVIFWPSGVATLRKLRQRNSYSSISTTYLNLWTISASYLKSSWKSLRSRRPPEKPLKWSFFKPEVTYPNSRSTISTCLPKK